MSYKKLYLVVLSLLFTASTLFSFDVGRDNSGVIDLVGKPVGTHNTVPLPKKIKANSNWVPLCKIDISTQNPGNYLYAVKEVTVTIKANSASFDYLTDIADLKIFTDEKNGNYQTNSTTTWDSSIYGSSIIESTTNVQTVVMKSSGTVGGLGWWKLLITFSNPVAVDQTNRWYTFYICIKTSPNLAGNEQFALRNNAGDISINIGSGGSENYDVVPNLPAFTTMTADTVAPILQVGYALDSDRGSSLTVWNYDQYNIYATTTDTDGNYQPNANNTINLQVTLTENGNSLTDNSIVPLDDLFTLDLSQIDGNLSNTKSISNADYSYDINYTLNAAYVTISSPTTPIPIRIKVRDAAGNESQWDESYFCYIDRTKPQAPIINYPPDNAYIGPNYPQLSWQDVNEPNHKVYVLIYATATNIWDWPTNGSYGYRYVNSLYNTWGQNTDWSNSYPNSSAEDTRYWGVVAIDKAGNIGFYPQAKPFKFDATAPNIYANTPTTNVSTKRPTISFRVDDTINNFNSSGIDFSTVTFLINNQLVSFSTSTVDSSTTTISFTPTSDLIDGTYNVKVYVLDNCKNVASKTWSFSIDTTNPESKDTDNDGYSDADEIYAGKNPNDPSSKPTTGQHFYPLNNQYVGSAEFVGTNQQKIKIRLDDTGIFTAGLDIAYTTSTNKIVVNHLAKGTTEQWAFVDSDSIINKSTFAVITIQLLRPFANNGTDDGKIQLTYYVQDKVGNTVGPIIRSFYYDTIKPVISTVTLPVNPDSESKLTFVIDVTDNFAVSNDFNAVQLILYDYASTPYNMTKISGTQYSVSVDPMGQPGIYPYYFKAKDAVGLTTIYPLGADADRNSALMLTVSDKTPPKGTIYKIDTLLNYIVTGINTSFTTQGAGATNVKSVPTLYADPVNDTSNDYNLIKATVPAETTSVYFEYKISTATTWTTLTANKTQEIVNNNPVWQAYWNTTGLATNTYYDIRVIASDQYGNTWTPSTTTDAGWVQVYLVPSLKPKSEIDITQNYPSATNGWLVSGPKLLLNADTHISSNTDIVSVKFQYKKLNDSSWTDIYTDESSTAPTKVTFYLKEAEIPYINVLNGVSISSITTVSFDELSDTKYDTSMTKLGDIWKTEVSFIPGTYTYNYKVQDKTSVNQITVKRDPREYGSTGGNSKLKINPFAYEWDISGLTDGESYQVRAIAKDSRGNEDNLAQPITIIYVGTVPQVPAITQPVNSQRIKSGANITIKASIPSTEKYISSIIFEYSSDGINWKTIGQDTTDTDGWSINYTLPTVASERTHYLRCFAYNNPPALSNASSVVSVVIDPILPNIESFVVEGVTGTVVLNSGSSYTLKATTLDTDISTVTFTLGGGVTGVLTNNGVFVSKTGGSGTVSDPYYYSCNFTPTNADNVLGGNITVKFYDSAGNTATKVINVQIRDITPTIAQITQFNNGAGNMPVSAGTTYNYIGRSDVVLTAVLNENDSGTLKFQYSQSVSGPWTTFAEVNIAGTTINSPAWNPLSNNIPEGTYYIRALAIDDDNNIDPQPAYVPFIFDYGIPTITSFTISPTGTIDCAKPFTFNVKTTDTDINNVTFQYYSAGAWVTITNATPLITAINNTTTPNSIGLNDINYICTAPGLTAPTTMQFRVVVTDKANNSATASLNVYFDDTSAPVAVPYLNNSIAAGNIDADTSDANVKSVVFQYRVAGSNSSWINLGTDIAPPGGGTFGNAGDTWRSNVTLGNLPAGVYEVRAIATDNFNNVDESKAPVITVLIQTNAAGSKTYSTKSPDQLKVGIKEVSFSGDRTVTLTLEVKSNTNLVSAPVISMLVTDENNNKITKSVQLSGSGTTYSGSITLDNFVPTGVGVIPTINISVSGDNGTGTVVGVADNIAISLPSPTPGVALPNGMAAINAWSGSALPNTTSVLIAPKIIPDIPTTQTSLLKPINRCYEFMFVDGTKQFPAGSWCSITLAYSDADLSGIDESKLGIAYWDTDKQRWSSEGISGVNVDKSANTISFRTTHFSAFAIMQIDTVPTITFESPKKEGYADEDPIISVKAEDGFSSIASMKIIIDGIDQTWNLIGVGAHDGIDNNGNGLVDEQDTANFVSETVFNTLSATSARFLVRAPLRLATGKHKLEVIATNAQSKSTTQSIEFTVSDNLNFVDEPYCYPNPFNPRTTTIKIVPNVTKASDVKVTIYDFAGNKVASLQKWITGSGTGPLNVIEWNGYEDRTNKYLADGVYFAEIEATSDTEVVKKFIKILISSK